MEEEIFGPVLPVIPYADIDDAVAFINARPGPLALYFLGADGEERAKLKRHTVSGSLGINNTIMHVAQDDIPFGGVGVSGMGSYHGVEGFRTMSHARAVFERGRLSVPRFLHAPFGKFADLALSTSIGRR